MHRILSGLTDRLGGSFLSPSQSIVHGAEPVVLSAIHPALLCSGGVITSWRKGIATALYKLFFTSGFYEGVSERERQFCLKVVVREVSTRLGRLHVGKRAGEAKRRGSDGGWQESCQEQADLPNYASKTCWRLSQVHTSPFLSHIHVTPLRPRLRAFDSSSRNAKRHPFPPTPNAWEGSPCPNSPLAFKFQGPHKKKVYSLQTMSRRNRVVEARISREAVPGDRVGDFVCFYLMTGRERWECGHVTIWFRWLRLLTTTVRPDEW